MTEKTYTPTHKKDTSENRQGIRLSKEQREEAQSKFLKTFAVSGNVRSACLQAGIDRSTVHYWSEHDEKFSMQYNIAKEDVNDVIRGEVLKRAVIGEERIVTSMGKVVYHEGQPLTTKEKSDTLLMFHAKSRMPEYRDSKHIDVTNNMNNKEMQLIHECISKALEPYPEAKQAVASALAGMETARAVAK